VGYGSERTGRGEGLQVVLLLFRRSRGRFGRGLSGEVEGINMRQREGDERKHGNQKKVDWSDSGSSRSLGEREGGENGGIRPDLRGGLVGLLEPRDSSSW